MIDIAIVGAGTAGMTAAIYARRAGMDVSVFEGNTYGGQIVATPEVENYPGYEKISGFDLADSIFRQASSLDAKFVFDQINKVEKTESGFVLKGDFGDYEARTVIIATGATNRHLGIDKEAELTGRGISYCATCDGAFFKDKVTAVAGGGNTAVEDALYLAGLCSKVYIIHRRDGFRAEETLMAKARETENIEILTPFVTESLEGEGKLSSVVLKNAVDGTTRTLEVDGLFVAIGQVPATKAFEDLVEMEGGYIKAGEDCVTSCPGVFVAGDVRTKHVRQLATAASDGAIAALAAVSCIKMQ
ncbi:MAG: thioredoxin-disulfide reductase [Clostridiales bacterium]|nr:thioredoxin-disulfide reductase [Clostridiales bacterium]